ncbi:hypothetical protein OGAPHI_000600 [Ogataea philodendri]|uniref:Uncharacterized protein n=1 Tax=Ogataea philodendri TaxID=1378263 RepID=A0A9P8PGJ7_9ASCO|nr:uncharacterized protein OGAPHI_000600 [Ogataea philodendri]KAH3670889.1 hypothetical protein OGAPHI_000600 [Ogataea philodendri]
MSSFCGCWSVDCCPKSRKSDWKLSRSRFIKSSADPNMSPVSCFDCCCLNISVCRCSSSCFFRTASSSIFFFIWASSCWIFLRSSSFADLAFKYRSTNSVSFRSSVWSSNTWLYLSKSRFRASVRGRATELELCGTTVLVAFPLSLYVSLSRIVAVVTKMLLAESFNAEDMV